MCADIVDLGFLGTGYPLYFNFVKQCIFMLLIMFVTSSDYNLFSNLQGDDCVPQN